MNIGDSKTVDGANGCGQLEKRTWVINEHHLQWAQFSQGASGLSVCTLKNNRLKSDSIWSRFMSTELSFGRIRGT